MDLILELYDTAKKDFESSKLLYDNEFFSVAIFQFQQSIEKFVKAYGLTAEIIEEKDLQNKISHLPHKVFARLFKRKIDYLNDLKKPTLIEDMIPPHQRGRDYEIKIKDLNKIYNRTNHLTPKSMESITSEELDQFIEGLVEIEKFEFDEDKIALEIEDDLVKTQIHLRSYFINELKNSEDSPAVKMIDYVLDNPEMVARQKMIEHKQSCIIYNKLNYLFYVWGNLSIITSPHEQKTRYPSTKNGCTPKDYNASNLIVAYFPKFVPLVNKSITIFKEILDVEEIKAFM